MAQVGGPKGPRDLDRTSSTTPPRGRDIRASRMSIFDILARSTRIEATVKVYNTNSGSDHTKELFGGKTVIGFQGFRTAIEDILIFELEGDELAVARFGKGNIIALEFNPPMGKPTIVALREDVAHKRLNLAMSMSEGRDVTYLDPATIAGAEVLNLNGDVTDVGLAKPLPLSQMDPSWYTEDWLTVRFEDDSRLVIRADRHTMKAVQRHKVGGTTVLVFGFKDAPTPSLPQLPIGNLPLLPILKKNQAK